MNIKNETGSALLLVLGLVGLVTALTYYVMDLGNLVNRNIKRASDSTKYVNFHDIFKDTISDPVICTNAFLGKTLAPAFTNPDDGVSLMPFSLNLFEKTETISAGWLSPVKNNITDIRLYIDPTPFVTGLKRDITASPVLNVANAEIRIFARHGTPGLNLGTHDHLKIKMMIYYEDNATKNLYSCFHDTSAAAFCTTIGGIYNAHAAIGTRPRCEPHRRCFVSEGGISSSASACVTPYSAISIGDALHLCQWCNQHANPHML